MIYLRPCVSLLNAEELAEKLHIDVRAIQALLGVLIALGFVERKNNELSLSLSSRTYLLSSSPYYWGSILESRFTQPETQRLFDAIRGDEAGLTHSGQSFSEMWEQGELSEEAAVNFTAKMHATIFAPAVAAVKSGVFSGVKHLLDVGAGSGCFSAAFVDEYPNSEATIFELAPVIKIIPNYLNQLASNGVVHLQEGNFFKDTWSKDCDAVLLSNILHDWQFQECELLLKKAFEALPKGGQIFIHEMLFNEDGSSPLATSCFNLLMYMNHRSQQFILNELSALLKKQGFTDVKSQQTFGYYSIVSAKK